MCHHPRPECCFYGISSVLFVHYWSLTNTQTVWFIQTLNLTQGEVNGFGYVWKFYWTLFGSNRLKMTQLKCTPPPFPSTWTAFSWFVTENLNTYTLKTKKKLNHPRGINHFANWVLDIATNRSSFITSMLICPCKGRNWNAVLHVAYHLHCIL